MQAVKKTVLEVLVLAVVGTGVALAVNSAQGSRGLKLTKNYFAKVAIPHRTPSPTPTEKKSEEKPEAAGKRAAAPKHGKHEYQDVSFAEAVAIFEDPNTESGGNIFVDARNDAAYEEGHIPGAVQADHYRLEDYIENLLDFAAGAEKIVVYCNGGNCEDSVLICGDLIEFEVPYESIYLFSGGWKAWTDGNMPVATGRDGE